MQQPKDYADIETLDEFIEYEYRLLSPLQKVTYHIQNHAVKLILLAIVCGYWAGMYFGAFWQ